MPPSVCGPQCPMSLHVCCQPTSVISQPLMVTHTYCHGFCGSELGWLAALQGTSRSPSRLVWAAGLVAPQGRSRFPPHAQLAGRLCVVCRWRQPSGPRRGASPAQCKPRLPALDPGGMVWPREAISDGMWEGLTLFLSLAELEPWKMVLSPSDLSPAQSLEIHAGPTDPRPQRPLPACPRSALLCSWPLLEGHGVFQPGLWLSCPP